MRLKMVRLLCVLRIAKRKAREPVAHNPPIVAPSHTDVEYD